MEEIEMEYANYWETNRFYQELDSWGMDGVILSCESSSPEGTTANSSTSNIDAGKNIETERNRRRKLNAKLYALRSVVPNITKMDKASIIKDAIECIQEMQEQEKKILAEINEFEFSKAQKKQSSSVGKRSKLMSKIDVTEIMVREAEEKSMVINITCNKDRGTMAVLCQLIESINLNILSANITTACGSILHTLFVEKDGLNCSQVKEKIENTIIMHNAALSSSSYACYN